jgi:hypothetical protein
METLSAAFFLIFPSAVLWAVHIHENYKPKRFRLGKLMILLVMIAYTVIVITFGTDAVLADSKVSIRSYSARFTLFFVTPGIAFGLILFPNIVGLFFDNHIRTISIQATELYAFYGWLMLCISALSIFLILSL